MRNILVILENPHFEQDHWSTTAIGMYKIGHDSIRLMKWIIYYDRSFYDNLNYFDLKGSNCKNSILNEYLDNIYYVEVKDHRYRIHPTENIILGLRTESKSLRTQYQDQNETQRRRNQKVIRDGNDELVVKNYPKKINQLFKNKNLNHQKVLLVNKIIG